LGVKLREMAHPYKYEDDPVLDGFDYVFDISGAELELLNPVDLAPSSGEDADDMFLEPSTSKWKPKSSAKSNAIPSKIPKTKAQPTAAPPQRLPTTRTRPTAASTSRTTATSSNNRLTRSASATRTATTTAKTTTTRPTTIPRPTNITKPAVTARAVRSSATAKAISPRKQVMSRTATSQVKPMKHLVPARKPNTAAGSSLTAKSGVARPPSGVTRKVGTTAGTFVGKKPTSPISKEKEDDLILKFDVQEEIDEFQFDV